MARLEELTRGAGIRGLLSDGSLATVVDVKWFGSRAVELTYKDASGNLGNQLIYRDSEPSLSIASQGRSWSFEADGAMLRLVSEAHRIRLAYLFDPLLAVHTSLVDPLPHQITAVYEEMLTRQPLRFLLADDPGAGKTIMAGLLIKELVVRGDLQKCMIVCPGSLVEQWQDELYRRFQLPFEILTNDKLESARTGNWFLENPLCICRLDKLSRDEDVQAKLGQIDWDLIIVDEAHKMAAHYFGGEATYTQRFRLGRFLSGLTRHFLLMTATPHNGKEADFQLFMSLLDGDRFEGRYREDVHVADTSDMMRRLVKEQLVKFDGTPLFPERVAVTVNYALSDLEAQLYRQVTDYVREQFNRADRLGSDPRKGTVGFALTSLQRRLASSPEAIYQSLRRRKERLEKRLREEKLMRRGEQAGSDVLVLDESPRLSDEDIDALEDGESPEGEYEDTEESVVDQATTARSITELGAEIRILEGLESLANQVRRGGSCKWDELSRLLQGSGEMFDAHGHRRKLLIFTEQRDTLNYLCHQIRNLVGRPEAVVAIHGGMGRDDRRRSQEAFTQDKGTIIMVATDAAGEGINLQRAHLMVNYDLPWNPNRLEQRFGRIHRIGQTEVCHCWNMVAAETREGEVFDLLLKKLEQERAALGGQVFDVLGKLRFDDKPLRDLLIEAIRYGDQPDVRDRLNQIVESALDTAKLRELLDERALAAETMDAGRIHAIREDMERAEARRLQPHYIASFFLEAFRRLGGAIHERETGRFEITRVPAVIRNRDRAIGIGEPVLSRYERVTFEKTRISVSGKPLAAFVCPGHPLLDATIDLVLERFRDLLRQGAVLVDESDGGDEPRALFYIEHAIQDGRPDTRDSSKRRSVSKSLQFVEMDKDGIATSAGYAPYLDYRPLEDDERAALERSLADVWDTDRLEGLALDFAVETLVPPHLEEVRTRREMLVKKTMGAVKERLTKEITYWDHRAADIAAQEEAGKTPKINSDNARRRADDLTERLQKRMAELEAERQISPLPPHVVGGALVVPRGLIAKLCRPDQSEEALFARETSRVEGIAMDAIIGVERRMGHEPRDVSASKCGYDIESLVPKDGVLRFIEVKGRISGAQTVTVTRNEILTGLNKPEAFILAIVQVDEDRASRIDYCLRSFRNEPDFAATSINFDIEKLINSASTIPIEPSLNSRRPNP